MSIAKRREARNLRQEDLAAIIGVDRTTVSKWETQINFPQASHLIKLADYFNCTTDELLREQPQPYPPEQPERKGGSHAESPRN